MQVIFFIFILLFILLIVYISRKAKQANNRMQIIISENNAKEMILGELIEGINVVNNGTFCYVTANE